MTQATLQSPTACGLQLRPLSCIGMFVTLHTRSAPRNIQLFRTFVGQTARRSDALMRGAVPELLWTGVRAGASAGDAADEPVATLRGPVSASVLAAVTAPAPVAEAPSAGTASVLPKNIVECVLIKRKAELLGALDIKSLSAVFQTSSTLAALADDASTWHRVYAARRAAPRQAPDAGLAIQTEEHDYAPLIPAPFGGGGGGGGAMDDDDVQLMAAPAAAPVHAMIIEDEEAPAEPEPGVTTVDEALGGHEATATAKKALLRAEDVTEEALGEDPGDAHVMLSVTNASAGRPRALEAGVYGISDEERAALDKVLEPAGVRSSFKSPGASSGGGPQYRPEDAEQIFNDAGGGMAGTLAIEAAIDAKGGNDDDEGLPPLIFEDPNGIVKPEKKAVVRITFRGQRDRDNEVPPDLDLAIAIKECKLELKDQENALDAIKDDLCAPASDSSRSSMASYMRRRGHAKR